MADAIRGRGTPLDRHSPRLFLVAGVLLVGYATLNGVTAVTGAPVEPNLFEVGYAVGFLALLGLYPRVADRQPWLARAGAAAALLGALAIAAFTVRGLAVLAGVADVTAPNTVFIGMALVGFVLGYIAFGAASLRAGALSRTTGLALLVPGAIVVLMLAHIAAGLDSPATAFVISAGQAMAHLAIGATLLAEGESTETEDAEPSPDSDAIARG